MRLRDIDLNAKLRPLFRMGTKLPPIVRSLVGCVVIVGGVLGAVVPILGVWMVPLGLLLIALDVPPWRDKITAWIETDPAATGD
jgi:hypothetical protein